MQLSEIITTYKDDYAKISYIDSALSAFIIYFFFGLFLLIFCGSLVPLTGLRGIALLVVFFGAIIGVGYVWVRLYQYYELRTPLKRKSMKFRLASGLECIKSMLSEIRENRDGIEGMIQMNNKKHHVTVGYTQNLWRNFGGIAANAPFSINVLKPPHPKTWFLKIQGETRLLNNQSIMFDFSGRSDDEDEFDGYGIRVFNKESKEVVKNMNKQQAALVNQIKTAISKTILKGTIDIENGQFTLSIYDNIKNIYRWKRPVFRFKSYQNTQTMLQKDIPEEQIAFHGMDEILSYLLL